MVKSWIWTNGLFLAPQSAPAREFEQLRAGRVELTRKARDCTLDEQQAVQALEHAERAARLARAEYAAMGGPADAMRSAMKDAEKARTSAERAASKLRDVQHALEYVERKANDLIARHAGELLHELGQPAEQAQAQAAEALEHARQALATWQAVERRREAILTSSGGALIHLRTPHDAIQHLAGRARSARGEPARSRSRTPRFT